MEKKLGLSALTALSSAECSALAHPVCRKIWLRVASPSALCSLAGPSPGVGNSGLAFAMPPLTRDSSLTSTAGSSPTLAKVFGELIGSCSAWETGCARCIAVVSWIRLSSFRRAELVITP